MGAAPHFYTLQQWQINISPAENNIKLQSLAKYSLTFVSIPLVLPLLLCGEGESTANGVNFVCQWL